MINAHKVRRLRILHAIHDFLPRHRAGSELYAYDLASAQAASHDVWVLAAEYEPTMPHGALRWRAYEQLPVIELINNWAFRTFDETYESPRLNRQIAHVLHAIQPDIVHVHNLLNLSFELPRLARERGARAVATLHDYTLVCAAGGQRVHTADAHLCETIDPDRCARCFAESPLGSQFAAGRTLGAGTLFKAAAHFYRRAPSVTRFLARTVGGSPSVTSEDLRRRLAASWSVFDMLDAVVAPSQSMATEYTRLGVSPRRLEVSSYGSTVVVQPRRTRASSVPNIGFAGTLIWHKGPHVLLQAARMLRGSFTITLHGDPAVAPDYFEDLKRQAHGLPVRFAGPFERTGMAGVYESLDLAVVPSLWPENAPFVIQEALAYRVPVVGSAIGGIPEFVHPGVNGALFECGSPASLAEVLQRLIDDPAERVRLGSSPVSIKSITQDAAEWDVRYERVLIRSSTAAVPATCQP
jgi:glycosyltransferase involved in cell wall biosynthesis